MSEPHCEAGTTNFRATPELDFDEVEADDDLPLLSPRYEKEKSKY